MINPTAQRIDYPLVAWVVTIFLGGAVNALAIQSFIAWYERGLAITQLVSVYGFVLFGAIVFLVPLALAFFFSKANPQRKLTPPLFMQAVSFGMLALSFYNTAIALYFLVMYTVLAGYVQDKIVVFALGRTGVSDCIDTYTFKVNAGVGKVSEILTMRQFRERLGYIKVVKPKIEGDRLIYKSRIAGNKRLIIELNKGDNANESVVNIACFENGWYAISKSVEVDELLRDKVAYLKDILSRHALSATDVTTADCKALVNYTLGATRGIASNIQEIAIGKRVLLVCIGTSFAAGIGLFIFSDITNGIAAVAVGAAFIVALLSKE